MTLASLSKAPFPWFGGKRKAAPLVWSLLGDVPHYVEPFFGSGAVLLERPHPANRPYGSETVNDLDGFVVNFWRAVQFHPVETAVAASWPVTEADKQARQVALLRWRDESVDRLSGDAMWCCPVMAGWWAWAVSVQIGAFAGRSAWTADPVTGRLVKQPPGRTREPGVIRNRPHLTGDGRGVNHAGTREPGVIRDLPHLGDDGRGVNRPGTREPGVLDAPPTDAADLHLLDATDWGAGYHDTVMPELIRWFRHLAARLRHVRVVNGDWSRVVTGGAAWTLPVRSGKGPAGVFLDPPYSSEDRAGGLYAAESFTVADDVRAWCAKHGDNPKFRIVLAGFDGEPVADLLAAGWTEHEWFTEGYLTGGMGQQKRDGDHQQHRERLWASPHCLAVHPEDGDQQDLFSTLGDA